MMNVNAKGQFLTTQVVASAIERAGGGAIMKLLPFLHRIRPASLLPSVALKSTIVSSSRGHDDL